ncbi:unnamed protein product [Paramecium octaurelia]|uniref:Uncharacterized protein n=1 Tax=Paramecium octaurelia TaxID=43137 RepID=A0A8S1SL88_PAROT|nr:unnamed protein product [Paramecium octaurelia]
MADQLNASFIKQSEDIIQQKKEEILQFFDQKGYKADSAFDDQLWFFPEINQDQEHILWKVISDTIGQDQVYDENFASEATIDTFVQKLLDQAKMIHLKILDFQKNIDYFKDELTNFDRFSKVIEANKPEYNQENALVISFVDQVNQISEMQKFYKLKYKVGTIHQNYQPLYPENSNRSTCVSLDNTIDSLTLVVMGKRLDKNLGDARTLGEDFKELAQIKIPILDIYQQIRPRHFALPTIPQCYLIVNYQDQSLDAPYIDNVTVNLRFDVRLSYDDRINIIKQQKEFKSGLIEKFQEKLKLRLTQMEQLLCPFKQNPKLQYVTAKGIGLKQDFKDEPIKPKNDRNKEDIKPPKERETCCIIQ